MKKALLLIPFVLSLTGCFVKDDLIIKELPKAVVNKINQQLKEKGIEYFSCDRAGATSSCSVTANGVSHHVSIRGAVRKGSSGRAEGVMWASKSFMSQHTPRRIC